MSERFSVYFSHSWRPEDVDLNLRIWDEISDRCNLLVDDHQEEQPPYYVNRLEEYIRRSDVFLAVLTYREKPAGGDGADANSDGAARCSAASLFEVRLAERARKPRLILYDTRTRFRPGPPVSKRVAYQPFEPQHLLDHRGTYVHDAIDEWLRHLEGRVVPRIRRPNEKAAVLLPQSDRRADAFERVRNALLEVGFADVFEMRDGTTDIEVLNQLYQSSLLVADVSAEPLAGVYAMAHALFLPTVRLVGSEAVSNPTGLVPWLLRGHPYGYQKDLVCWDDLDELGAGVRARAEAMRDTRKLIDAPEEGRRMFERRRYRPHRVFISHNLKGGDRPVIDAVVAGLERRAIDCWEYQWANRSGDNWRKKMNEEMARATHVVAIFGPDYELSEACNTELTTLLARGDEVTWRGFLWQRARPNPHLAHVQNAPLDDDPERAAEKVVAAMVEVLRK